MTMNIKGILAASALAATVAMPAQAHAAGTFNNYDPVMQSGTFGNNGGIGDRTFTNTFTFVVTRAGTLATDFSNTSQGNPAIVNGGPADIDFTGATLSGGTLAASVAYSRLIGEPLTRTEVWSVAAPLFLGAGTYRVAVTGRSYGQPATYSGNFNVAAVPESTTWAMMIGGIGLVGGLQRRRRTVATKVRFA